MLDFLSIEVKIGKNGIAEIYPSFLIKKSKDLMVRGGDFYAFWNEEEGFWSTDEDCLRTIVDKELKRYVEDYSSKHIDTKVKVDYMIDCDSGSIDRWHKYCQKQMRDSYSGLDENILFSNTEIKKENYATRTLKYPLSFSSHESWDEILNTLYSEEERFKIEWAIGSVVSGESKIIQKFFVFYGSAGTGKSTVLNIIQMLFDGYWVPFDGKALGQGNNNFSMEAFASNPLLAIQHDGDLSKIEDNTRLNSIVSHETMVINEKFKKSYPIKLNTMLFMGTNKPVKITDSKSGILRRLIDISPSGNTIPNKRYVELMDRIKFELGGIAQHCLDVFKDNKNAFDNYIPVKMMDESNSFYNYILDNSDIFGGQEYVTLKQAWEAYKNYCEDSGVQYPYSKMIFKAELKSYFEEFKERYWDTENNIQARNVYFHFLDDRFTLKKDKPKVVKDGLRFDYDESLLDLELENCKAQYANAEGTPIKKWTDVKTKLSDIDSRKLHYVKVPQNHIVIDFDLKTKDGNKSFKKNVEAANKWPPTYAELSKSGEGIHLHYIYDGDVSKLSRIYDDDIEIKVFTGNSSLRRKLTKCNNIPIRTINSGLPLKGEVKMLDFDGIKSEKHLRNLISKALKKEIHANTKPNVDYINSILDQAYASGMKYDVTDMRPSVLLFCTNSTNQSEACLKIYNKMKFKSEEASECKEEYNSDELVFYDVEVFPNLFVVVYKKKGSDCREMINPTPAEIEALTKFKLVGFNCRRYDNHILYARIMGYNNEELFKLSQRIVDTKKGSGSNCFFGEAYNLSYTDIYDFASAGNKKSLKKLEIEMGIHHQELGLPWDEPVPEEKWKLVADYCCNDVVATEAAFEYLEADWTARQILSDLAEMTVNDTTNSLTTRIIFGKERHPQGVFQYRDMSKPVKTLRGDVAEFLKEACPEMMSVRHGPERSLLPYFPGYVFDKGKSIYLGEEAGEGGFVYAEPGMYGNVALLDVASMHPHSTIAECLFGVEYTEAFRDIVEGRVSIKHEDWDVVDKILNGKLTPYIQKVKDGKMSSGQLANALKTAINSVYGLTAAKFENPFRDPRNVDNIVAKRGALFMIDLKKAVQEKGFTVAHIKTDSIKIPDATPEIIEFIINFGKKYGYTFEHEATYDRMCLVNNAVYIARYKKTDECKDMYGYVPGDNAKHGGEWTATGTQFAVPYVFKTLFSHEPYEFKDFCETKTVSTALYLDMNEGLGQDEHSYHFIGKAGLFCPIKPGCGGGILLASRGDKYDSVTGTKDYRWLESEMVDSLNKADDIDKEYYKGLANDAIEAISQYGDYEWFVSDESYVPDKASSEPVYDFMNIPEGCDEPGIPFDELPESSVVPWKE